MDYRTIVAELRLFETLCRHSRGKGEIALLIKNSADAIEELSKLADAIPHVCECCIGCEVESGGCDYAFVLSPKRVREYLNKLRWIPVTEGLPKDTTQVLVYSGILAPFIEVAFYDGLWYSAWDGKTEIEAVTHWMPLS